jgi:hypothetical protein
MVLWDRGRYVYEVKDEKLFVLAAIRNCIDFEEVCKLP